MNDLDVIVTKKYVDEYLEEIRGVRLCFLSNIVGGVGSCKDCTLYEVEGQCVRYRYGNMHVK